MLRRLAIAHVRASRPAARMLSQSKPKPPSPPARPTSPENLTRAEVESLAESSKAGQRLIDMENSMFGGNMSLPTTLLLGLACVAMFAENNRRRTVKEDLEEQHEQLREERLQAKIGAARDDPVQIRSVLARKREQLE